MPHWTPISAVIPTGPNRFVKSIAKVAAALQMSEATLRSWAATGEYKPTKSGYWSTKAAADIVRRKNRERGLHELEDGSLEYDPELDERFRDAKSGGPGSRASGMTTTEDPLYLDAQLKRIKIKSSELDYNVKAGNLVVRNEVEAIFVNKIMVLKQSLLTIGRDVAPLLAGQTDLNIIRDIIDGKIKHHIRVFADQDANA